MRKTISQIVVLMAGIAVSGCMTGGQSATGSASLIGGFAGTRAITSGEAAASAVVGGMAGGLVAGNLGKGLSSADRRQALAAEYQALEYAQNGKTVDWTSGGVRGEVVAAQPYRVGSQDCRQYEHTVYVNGDQATARGTACRNDDGSWSVLT